MLRDNDTVVGFAYVPEKVYPVAWRDKTEGLGVRTK